MCVCLCVHVIVSATTGIGDSEHGLCRCPLRQATIGGHRWQQEHRRVRLRRVQCHRGEVLLESVDPRVGLRLSVCLSDHGIVCVQPNGVEKNLGLPDLSAYEKELLKSAMPELLANIATGIKFAGQYTPK